MAKLSVGIIGTGFGAKVHVPAFRTIPAVEVVAIAGQDRHKAALVGQTFGISMVHDSWKSLINDEKVEAVVVAVPPSVHFDVVTAALRAGKHVFCEKPFGVDADQAARMWELSRESHTVCMVNYMFRTAPERVRLKELLDGNEIGRIIRVTVEWTVRGRAAGNSAWSWQFDPSFGGGVLFAFGAHVVDYLQWLVGPVRSVTARLSTRGGPSLSPPVGRSVAADTLDAILLLDGDIPVSITVSNATPGGRGHWLTIYGERGALIVGNANLADTVIGTRLYQSDLTTGTLRELAVESIAGEGVTDGRTLLVGLMAERFVAAIRSGTSAAPSFEDGWRTQVVMDAMRLAHERQRWMPVRLPSAQDRFRSPSPRVQ
ncbi:MAG: Gfo/Idh/MocA family oxidoreductase [Nitrospira sp.]|nr:Gfo/Idh/MocA family oxidoreductase [Nitrospira sp.]